MRKRMPSMWKALTARPSASHSSIILSVSGPCCRRRSETSSSMRAAATWRSSVVVMSADYLNQLSFGGGSIRRLPDHPTDEEGPEAIQVERGLLRLAHGLNDR